MSPREEPLAARRRSTRITRVSVVMPFMGDARAARTAQDALLSLAREPGDELIFADNSGLAAAAPGIELVHASGERSPAHARNVGAARARNDWILFLDADCSPPEDLLDEYFVEPIAQDVGAVAGEVVPAADAEGLAARYGAARSFLGQRAHLAHPYLPRAVAANMLVRSAAFAAVGGFYEGVRAAEDTDFSWRLQQAGWRLEPRPSASVEHRYRATVSQLRRQWRGYAAGRAWLARRYDGFQPEPAIRRVLTRKRSRSRAARTVTGVGRLERGRYLALDALLSAEELVGLALSNRPAEPGRAPAAVVLVADRFPSRGDPLAEFALTLEGARVEAAARPELLELRVARELEIAYREDDGLAARLVTVLALVARHPLRSMWDLARRRRDDPRLIVLAPAIRRLERCRGARVHALGGESLRRTARRMARLAGRRLEEPRQGQLRGSWPHRAR